MKLLNKFLVLSSLLALLVTFGCNKKTGYQTSTDLVGKASLKTGWSYNNSKKGFFDVWEACRSD
jgi:hypothetical protein